MIYSFSPPCVYLYVCILFEETQRSTGTRTMRTTKPVFFKLRSSMAALLKVSKLEKGSGAGCTTYTTSCAHAHWRIPPISKNGADFMVLCTFNVREVLSDWPILQLRLSKSVENTMQKLVASPPSYSFVAPPQTSFPTPIRSSWLPFQSAPIQSTPFHCA
jgi:hypothetical protein